MLDKIEQILAQQIGSLSLANTKQSVRIESLQQQRFFTSNEPHPPRGEAMLSRIEQILAQQIGSLSLANTKQTVTIEALQQQLVEREARIAELEAQLAGPAQPVEDDADYPNKRRLTKSH